MKWRTGIVLLLFMTLAIPASGATEGALDAQLSSAQAAAAPVINCSDISRLDLATIADAPTAVFSSQLVPESANAVEHCRVTAYVAPQVQFILLLPTQNWNGRYFQAGCGGYCGSIGGGQEAACRGAVNQGFAAAATNMGHAGTSGFDGLWALGNQQAVVDYGHRAVHVVAVASKAIVNHFYGTPPEYSYFQGCSGGGREGLMQAQRYPDDFDGIVAGAPAALFSQLVALHNLNDQRVNRDEDGRQIIGAAEVNLVRDAALAACDAADGLADGIISDPRGCDFDPASLTCAAGQTEGCLTPQQVETARGFYGGPVLPRGRSEVGLYPGAGAGPGVKFPGSEPNWQAWLTVSNDLTDPLNRQGFTADQYLKYFAFDNPPGPEYDIGEFDFSRDLQRLKQSARILDATDPDLSAFRARGGKLIVWHGWGDAAIPPTGTLWYYAQLQKRFGGLAAVQDWARLFMLPGVLHCSGGPGPNQFDFLSAVIDWVEHDVAPDEVLTRRVVGGQEQWSRPAFPYPMEAVYSGTGDPTEASSFVGVMPDPLPDDDFDWRYVLPERLRP